MGIAMIADKHPALVILVADTPILNTLRAAHPAFDARIGFAFGVGLQILRQGREQTFCLPDRISIGVPKYGDGDNEGEELHDICHYYYPVLNGWLEIRCVSGFARNCFSGCFKNKLLRS